MAEGNSGGIPLNEPQARSLAVGVRRLGELLDTIARLLDDAPRLPAARVPIPDIADAERQDARHYLAAARQALQELLDKLGVAAERQSLRSAFSAYSASAWTEAEDLHPRRLRGYGPVDARAEAILAPLTERLATSLAQLSAAVPPATSATAEHHVS